MEVLYQLGEASVHDVVSRMEDDLSYDTVRVTLSILMKKGVLDRRRDGKRHIYRPVISHDRASRQAVRNLLKTFFNGSPSRAMLAMLDVSSEDLTEEELAEIEELIEREKRS
jgi:predicted transcriptional regulator